MILWFFKRKIQGKKFLGYIGFCCIICRPSQVLIFPKRKSQIGLLFTELWVLKGKNMSSRSFGDYEGQGHQTYFPTVYSYGLYFVKMSEP